VEGNYVKRMNFLIKCHASWIAKCIWFENMPPKQKHRGMPRYHNLNKFVNFYYNLFLVIAFHNYSLIFLKQTDPSYPVYWVHSSYTNRWHIHKPIFGFISEAEKSFQQVNQCFFFCCTYFLISYPCRKLSRYTMK